MRKFSPHHVDTLQMAVALANVAHWRVDRMDGSEFFKHCERVMNTAMEFARDAGFDANGVPLVGAVGVLHDVVEDTKCPIEFVRSKFGAVVADAVQVLTRPKDLRDPDEVNRVYNHTIATSWNAVAAVVKLADILDNAAGALALRDVKRSRYGWSSPEHVKAVDFGKRWGKKALGSLNAVAGLARAVDLSAPLTPMITAAAELLRQLAELPQEVDFPAAGYPNLGS